MLLYNLVQFAIRQGRRICSFSLAQPFSKQIVPPSPPIITYEDGKVRESEPVSNESALMPIARNNFSILISSPTSSARCTCIIRLHLQLPRDRATLNEQFMRKATCCPASSIKLCISNKLRFVSGHRYVTDLIAIKKIKIIKKQKYASCFSCCQFFFFFFFLLDCLETGKFKKRKTTCQRREPF